MSQTLDATEAPRLQVHGIAHICIGLIVGTITKLVFLLRRDAELVAGSVAIPMRHTFNASLPQKVSLLAERSSALHRNCPNGGTDPWYLSSLRDLIGRAVESTAMRGWHSN